MIDTSAFIEFLNHTGSDTDKLVEKLISGDDEIALADVTLTEILQGIRNDLEWRQVKASLLTFQILSLKGTESHVAAAEIYRKCRKKGITLRSTVDLLIAQTTIEHGARLVHHDRDFDAIAMTCGLLLYPGEPASSS